MQSSAVGGGDRKVMLCFSCLLFSLLVRQKGERARMCERLEEGGRGGFVKWPDGEELVVSTAEGLVRNFKWDQSAYSSSCCAAA